MKVLHETPYFDLVKNDEKHGLRIKITSVAVLPYTIDSTGIVEKIGILKEPNALRDTGYADTLITGSIEDSDDDAYSTAVRELYEEGGVDMRSGSPDNWTYLGAFHDSKDTDREIPTFAVDITGQELGKPQTDGSDHEKNCLFSLVDVNEAIATKELLVLGSFLRLFNIMYKKSFKNAK